MALAEPQNTSFRLGAYLRARGLDGRLARFSALVFGLLGLVAGVATYAVLSNLTPLRPTPVIIWTLLSANIFIVTGLLFIIAWQFFAIARARRKGKAGAKLHAHLVSLFSFIAALPAVLVAIFASVTLDRGLDSWFSDRTKSIISGSTAIASAYLLEQREVLQRDITMMATDLGRAAGVFQRDPMRFQKFLQAQAALRSLPQALIVTRNGNVLVAASPDQKILTDLPPGGAFESADSEQPAVMTVSSKAQVQALIKIDGFDNGYLYAARLISPEIIGYLQQTDAALSEYTLMESRRYDAQITFSLVYVVLTLVILLSAIWLGLGYARRLTRPIAQLMRATEQLSDGDLDARVMHIPARQDDEMRQLSRRFNIMAERLGTQQKQLVETRDKLDTRARFTEMVLNGVSSGVVGADENGIIRHANAVACDLFNKNRDGLIGTPLKQAMPEFADIEKMARAAGRVQNQQIAKTGARRSEHVLLAAAAMSDTAEGKSLVITFDDITDMLAAQRNAAWADIARRIAHEIKNPLTPIQLSAERLRNKFSNAVEDDDKVFEKCTDTILRQVDDIGRMVNEFASFARMPQAVIQDFDIAACLSQTVFSQRITHPGIQIIYDNPGPTLMQGDERLVAQVITNAIKNAQEAIIGNVDNPHQDDLGQIDLSVEANDGEIRITVTDSGPGWPEADRYSLLEPYKTSRPTGTGLGLSIVKKVMADHGGKLLLEDAPICIEGGTGASLVLVFPRYHEQTVGHSKIHEEV